MAKRRKATTSSRKPASSTSFSSGGAGKVLLIVFIGFAGVATGYLWRSYAPLPFFEGTALSSSNVEKKKKESLEAEKIRKELEEIDEMREEKEAELGDAQIKAILSD